MLIEMRRSLCVRYVGTPISLVAFLSACASWSPVERVPAEFIRDQEPDRIRVVVSADLRPTCYWECQGGMFVLLSPTTTTREIIGTLETDSTSVRVELDRVEAMEHYRSGGDRTVTIVFLTAATVGVLVGVAIAFSNACIISCDR